MMSFKRKNLRSKFHGNTLDVIHAEIETSKAQIDLEYVERREVSLIIPILDNDRILMVKQYRVSLDQEILEFPGGKVEAGENPMEAAIRELEEETGYVASDLKELVSFYSAPHFTNEKVRIFLARGLSKRGEKTLEIEEQIKTVIVDYYELIGSFKKKIIDAKTLIGIGELEKVYNL